MRFKSIGPLGQQIDIIGDALGYAWGVAGEPGNYWQRARILRQPEWPTGVSRPAFRKTATKRKQLQDGVGLGRSYSIVIPAYNEEQRIGTTLERTLAYFADRPRRWVEVLVVDDGSTDATAGLIEACQSQNPQIRLLRHEKNKGKGWAVRTGMLAAEGGYVLFMDADGSTDIGEIEKLSRALDEGADIAIGTRDVTGSEIRQHQPWLRETMGKAFSWIAREFAIPGIEDTTCGFKLFRNSVIEPLFGRQIIPGWAFDVEILYLAMRQGYSVAEIQVHWTDSPDSHRSSLRWSLGNLPPAVVQESGISRPRPESLRMLPC